MAEMNALRLPILATTLLALAAVARADDWAGPRVREVFSENRNRFVRVIPGSSWGDTIGFMGTPKGPYAKAEFYTRQADKSYRLTASATLLNPVAPVEFFVSDEGRLATIDNWHNAGYGKVVAIYDGHGVPVKSFTLEDLFTAAEIEGFRKSISSIWWSTTPVYIRSDQKTLFVSTDTVSRGAGFLFGLESGRFQFCETRAGQYRCRNSAAGPWKTGVETGVER